MFLYNSLLLLCSAVSKDRPNTTGKEVACARVRGCGGGGSWESTARVVLSLPLPR